MKKFFISFEAAMGNDEQELREMVEKVNEFNQRYAEKYWQRDAIKISKHHLIKDNATVSGFLVEDDHCINIGQTVADSFFDTMQLLFGRYRNKPGVTLISDEELDRLIEGGVVMAA